MAEDKLSIGVIKLSDELENIGKAIKAIGLTEISLREALVSGVQKALVEKGYDAAIVYTEQYFLSTDVNADLVRILMICRRYGLSPEAAAEVLDKLIEIEHGNGK